MSSKFSHKSAIKLGLKLVFFSSEWKTNWASISVFQPWYGIRHRAEEYLLPRFYHFTCGYSFSSLSEVEAEAPETLEDEESPAKLLLADLLLHWLHPYSPTQLQARANNFTNSSLGTNSPLHQLKAEGEKTEASGSQTFCWLIQCCLLFWMNVWGL